MSLQEHFEAKDRATRDRNTRRETRREQAHFAHARRSEREYARHLRSVARHIGELVKQMLPREDASLEEVEQARFKIDAVMHRYSQSLRPWAEVVSRRMLQDVMRRDETAWAKHSQGMGRALREEVRDTPTGQWFTNSMAEQVRLITSLPMDAAQRVHERVLRAQETGMRAEELAKELAATGQVTRSRAALIARTETARASSNLTQARAIHIGADSYIWRTAGDVDVRKEHKKHNGKVFKWSEPPIAGTNGMRYHAGAGPNCFTGDTLISLSNGCNHVLRGFFHGDLVVLSAFGVDLSATPNHPILTTRGWLPAKSIECGDDLVQFIGNPERIIDKNKDHTQLPTFEQVYRAFRLCGKSETVFEADLYGDILYGDINIVSIDDLLPDYSMAEKFKCIGDLAFTSSDRRVLDSVITGGFDHIGVSFDTSLSNLGLAIRERRLCEPSAVSGTSPPTLNTVSSEELGYRGGCGFETFGQGKPTHSIEIELDYLALRQVVSSILSSEQLPSRDRYTPRSKLFTKTIGMGINDCSSLLKKHSSEYETLRVINKGSRSFSGHVYSMETMMGWYPTTHTGIISKNCRCYPEPVVPEEIQ